MRSQEVEGASPSLCASRGIMLDKKDTQKLYDMFTHLIGKKSYMLLDSLLSSDIAQTLTQNEMLNVVIITYSDREFLKRRADFIEKCTKILQNRKEKISPNFNAYR